MAEAAEARVLVVTARTREVVVEQQQAARATEGSVVRRRLRHHPHNCSGLAPQRKASRRS